MAMGKLKQNYSYLLHPRGARKQGPRTILDFGGLRSQDTCPVCLEFSKKHAGYPHIALFMDHIQTAGMLTFSSQDLKKSSSYCTGNLLPDV